jgi:hypothetical protein
MQSTNIGRTPERREGRRKLLAVSAALVMALAALLLTLALTSSIEPSNAAVQKKMPYTFFFTHYQLLGDPNNPEGVRYHNNGKPFAKPRMARRSSSRARALGTQRQMPPRVVVTIPSGAPLEHSKHRVHGG